MKDTEAVCIECGCTYDYWLGGTRDNWIDDDGCYTGLCPMCCGDYYVDD